MKFESGLEFGRHSEIINKAYRKMISESATDDSDNVSSNWRMDVTADDVKSVGFGGGRSRYERRPVIPEYIRAAAEKAGYKFPQEHLDATYSPYGYSDEPVKKQEEVAPIEYSDDEDIDSEDENSISVEEDFYNKTIGAEENSDIFNSQNYNMEELALHKMEILDAAIPFISKGYDDVRAVVKALDTIPGCEYIGQESEDVSEK